MRYWSRNDVRILRKYYANNLLKRTEAGGFSLQELANTLNRSVQSIAQKASELRIGITGRASGQYKPVLYLIDEESGCWIWNKQKTGGGYGLMQISNTRKVLAHVWMYRQKVGGIPEGKELDHLCRNHSCVNPEHLEAVTHQENLKRAHINSKLTEDKVTQIRELYSTGRYTHEKLAFKFGVKRTTITAVLNRQNWK